MHLYVSGPHHITLSLTNNSPDPAAGAASGTGTVGARSPGSGVERPPSERSWRSSAPGTPQTLTERILRRFDPTKESLEAYQERVRRMVRALEVLGESLAPDVVETALAVGTLIQKMQNVTADPQEQLRLLRREFAYEFRKLR